MPILSFYIKLIVYQVIILLRPRMCIIFQLFYEYINAAILVVALSVHVSRNHESRGIMLDIKCVLS
jgi:hypothetical protein